MYRITGIDGKTYGPVDAGKIREWTAQGRVDSRTPVCVEGANNWTSLGLLPEFANEFSGPPPVITPLQPGTGPAKKTNSFATAGLIFGILSWACCCGFPFNMLGLIFSIIALAQIGAPPQNQEGRTFAIIGLILSALSLLGGLGFLLFRLAAFPLHGHWHLGPI